MRRVIKWLIIVRYTMTHQTSFTLELSIHMTQ